MPEKLARSVKIQALQIHHNGMTQAEAAATMGISDRTIRRAKSKIEKHEDIEGGQKKRGRKPKLTAEMEDVFGYSLTFSNP